MKTRLMFLPCIGACASALAQTTDRPNVILLVADDLGYGDLSCYGATMVETPNVDNLAANGVRFTDCHAVASTSTPSRYSLLTGEYCFRRPGTDIAAGNAGMIIRPHQYTMADMFHSAGYKTAAIGKWHLGLGLETGQQDWNGELDATPKDLGFDYHYLMAATSDRVPCVFIENGRIANYDPDAPVYVSYQKNFDGEPTGASNPELLTKLKPSHGHNQSIVNGISRIGYMKGGGKALWKDENLADSIIAHSVKFIEENKDNPFFMYLCTNDVHVPRYPHDRFRNKNAMGLRGDAIVQFDYTVGQIYQTLEKLGLAENTLLVITSDNGPVLDDGYIDQAKEKVGTHKPGGPWRGGKYSAFEAGTAVPFIVHWPARIKSGKTSGALISHIDNLATFAEIAGVQIPAGAAYDSQSHVGTWTGEDENDREYVVEMSQARSLGLRTSRWKYIEPSNGNATQGQTGIETGYKSTPQLYDISASRYETTDVYTTQSETAARLSALLAEKRMPLTSADTCFYYHLYTPERNNRYATATGKSTGINGTESPDGQASQWMFVLRPDGDYDIVNRAYKSYLQPGVVQKPALQVKTGTKSPSTGWKLTTSGQMSCLFAVVNGNSQINQALASRNWMVVNWGDGTNTTDAGCRYAVVIADAEVSENIPDGIETVEIKADNLVVRDGKFILSDSGRPVDVFTIDGKRVTAISRSRMHGIYLIRDRRHTAKLIL